MRLKYRTSFYRLPSGISLGCVRNIIRTYLQRCSVVTALICYSLLPACEQREEISPDSFRPVNTDVLHFKTRSCRYSKHNYAQFRCYDAARQDGIRHSYPVTIIEPRNIGPESATIVSVPGGPGQGAQTDEAWVQSWADWLEHHGLSHRIIVYEPFGTFGSNTFWSCREYDKLSLLVAAQPLSVSEEVEKLEPALLRCLEDYDHKLRNEFGVSGGLAWLNSIEVSRSLRYLIGALPTEKVQLLGTSYGTRVALLAAEDSKVASLVLDSPYPFAKGTLADWPGLLGQAFLRHEESFKRHNEGTGSYKALFENAYLWLLNKPQPWRLERWDGSGKINLSLTADRLLLLHYHVLYDESMLPHYYAALKQFPSTSDEMRWVLEDLVTIAFDSSFSYLVYIAVECNDNKATDKASFLASAKTSADQFTDWQTFYNEDVCELSFFDNAKPIQKQEYASKPTIILSGELDPVTPAEWGRGLNKELSDSEFYLRREKGHAVLSTESCLMPRLNKFWLEHAGEVESSEVGRDSIYSSYRERCAAE